MALNPKPYTLKPYTLNPKNLNPTPYSARALKHLEAHHLNAPKVCRTLAVLWVLGHSFTLFYLFIFIFFGGGF